MCRRYETGGKIESTTHRLLMFLLGWRRGCNPNKSLTWAMHPGLRTRGGGTIHGEEAIEGRVYVCSSDDTAAAAVCAYEDTIFLVPYWHRLFSPICAWVPAECRFVPHTTQ